jgi:adenosylcobyric acid synthase
MSVMVLGTASHVGKSMTVTALCRILSNRGVTVAPFKSQNMSLNSYVTCSGAEIGIAQAIQAFAARLDPEAEMNPVLLKPKGDSESQVVLMGKPYQDVRVGEYYRQTEPLLALVTDAYHRLAKQYGSVVIEGAGGAAECNLFSRDIANILLARNLQLPIILVADIERGGVFAQLYGTIMLLPDDIRPLVRGIIVNKFRGDASLFDEGVRILEEKCGVPVLGIIPYTDIALPSEDSLSIADKKARDGDIRIGIIRLPRIANFTDFELLERYAPVDFVPPGTSLQEYDAIIIPGTKNTIADMDIIRSTGCDREILEAAKRGIPIIGICGGYQMLGKEIHDHGIEARDCVIEGLGLLDITTEFTGYAKTTVQVQRTASSNGPILSRIDTVSGYEIHMGTTNTEKCRHAFETEGAVSENGLIFGTYLHGLFLNRNAVDGLLSYLCEKKGVDYTPLPESYTEFTDDAYEKLAAHFERYLDMDAIMNFFEIDN